MSPEDAPVNSNINRDGTAAPAKGRLSVSGLQSRRPSAPSSRKPQRIWSVKVDRSSALSRDKSEALRLNS
jgi:hypothetical protein